MNYYLNEYSLRGQFDSVEDFYTSFRKDTLPVLKRIEQENGSIIWKKDIFWNCEVCSGIKIFCIPKKKNERGAENVALHLMLSRLCTENIYKNVLSDDVKVQDYHFDEEYKEYFEDNNCFQKAIETEGRIISFCHPEYQMEKLSISVSWNDAVHKVFLDNITSVLWWDKLPLVHTWRINNKYLVEVRSNEFEYHPPHFHVSHNEYAVMMRLFDGEVYASSKKGVTPAMLAEINDWYQENRKNLMLAWKRLHGENSFMNCE